MQGRHKGRLVAITGGSSGIGQAMVLRLVAEGARVAILDVGDCAETIALAHDIAKQPGSVAGFKCDIGSSENVAAAAAALQAQLGQPNILVHCAAMQFMKPFEQLTIEDWRAIHRVNVEGAFNVVQAFLPAMRAAQWGRIVLVASSSFFAPPPGMTHYIATKGALLGFVRGLATEVGGQGITVNALAPGLTRTSNAIKGVPQQHFDFVVSRQAVKRSGEPEDQAAAVSFLVSDDAAFMSGQTLLVDGGEGHV
jgi:NAD(P)-dependent dehydrogenase (short-subunit alcohol dehydrogenase family)